MGRRKTKLEKSWREEGEEVRGEEMTEDKIVLKKNDKKEEEERPGCEG